MKTPETNDETLDPRVERELDALDRALGGEEVEPEFADLARFAEGLAGERPQPEQRWRDEMDGRAGERFGGSRLGSLKRWVSGLSGRRLLVPAAGLATLAVVAVGVGTSVDTGSDDVGDVATPSSLDGGSTGALRGEDALGFTESGAPQSSPAERNSAAEAPPAVADSTTLPGPGSGQNAPGKDKRLQDRSAFLALKTGTEDVRDVSDRAIQITESAGGVVLSSQLTEREMRATATIDIQVPTRELDGVLDQLTDLATVESLNEAAVDITRPFVSARDELRDARAERKELLKALGNASTDEETEAIRKQLKQARREISRAEAAFDNIARRARNSQVGLEITGTPDGGGDGSWSLGDAADDALSALKTVAGVMLIAAAILAPIALLAVVVALVTRAVRQGRRERALDEE